MPTPVARHLEVSFTLAGFSHLFRVSGSGGFRWKLNSLLLLTAIGFLVNRDLQRHGGSFVKSRTGIFLADVGLYEPVMRSIDYGAKAYDAGYGWAEKNNLPGYVAHSHPAP